jgi:hypothetical protein
MGRQRQQNTKSQQLEDDDDGDGDTIAVFLDSLFQSQDVLLDDGNDDDEGVYSLGLDHPFNGRSGTDSSISDAGQLGLRVPILVVKKTYIFHVETFQF